jgi:GPN-loop GTPase
LDPAAEDFTYEPNLDIKDLISLDDVMEEMSLGPNGGLVYCFEFLLENLDFLDEAIEDVPEDSLIVIDMPGQIELYTHIPLVPRLVAHLTASGALGVRLCAAYLLESTFIVDRAKFFAGTLSAMSAMLLLEMPHINILSKMDLVKGQIPKRDFKRFVDPDASLLDEEDPRNVRAARAGEMVVPTVAQEDGDGEVENATSVMRGASFRRLNKAVAGLIDEFSMVSFLQLDVQDEDSVEAILSYIDDAIQFHEAQEPKEPKDSIYDTMDGMED